jgi:type I restriction enzyme, R subunit
LQRGLDSRRQQRPDRPASQIEFVNLTVNHLTEHGLMTAALLCESPFTDVTPSGLFGSSQVDELVRTLDTIEATALPS